MPLDRLSAEDVRILDLEAGNIRGHVCKVVVLRPAEGRPLPTLGELRAHVDGCLDAAPRLRRRLIRSPLTAGSSLWVDDEAFDIARHVRAVEEPGPVGPERLREIVARLMAERLDRAHPLWRIDVVEAMSDGSMALVWRIHHCLADGATTMRLAGEILWTGTPDAAPVAPSAWRPTPAPGGISLLARCTAAGLGPAARRARSAGRPGARARAGEAPRGGLEGGGEARTRPHRAADTARPCRGSRAPDRVRVRPVRGLPLSGEGDRPRGDGQRRRARRRRGRDARVARAPRAARAGRFARRCP